MYTHTHDTNHTEPSPFIYPRIPFIIFPSAKTKKTKSGRDVNPFKLCTDCVKGHTGVEEEVKERGMEKNGAIARVLYGPAVVVPRT